MKKRSSGIRIIGDFPMFMNYDAADIWLHPELFKVDRNLKPLFLAGSPPDSFSEKGQLFNCAVYDWSRLQATGFAWWLSGVAQRLADLTQRYDRAS